MADDNKQSYWISDAPKASAAKDNSNILSSTKSDGIRPAWQQAKDFLDSNWLTSMASYVLPGIGTARMIDDAVGNFKEDRALAGLGDLGLAALSVIPGIGQALGVTSKAGKGLSGMMKAIKGGDGAAAAARGGAEGLLREGSVLGNAAKASRDAEAAAKASRLTTEGSKLQQATAAERDAQRALGFAERDLADEAAEVAKTNRGYATRNQTHLAEEQARLDREYEQRMADELIKARAYPHPAQPATPGIPATPPVYAQTPKGRVRMQGGQPVVQTPGTPAVPGRPAVPAQSVADRYAQLGSERMQILSEREALIRSNEQQLAAMGVKKGVPNAKQVTQGSGAAKKTTTSYKNVFGEGNYDLSGLNKADRDTATKLISEIDDANATIRQVTDFNPNIVRGTAQPLARAEVSAATQDAVKSARRAQEEAAFKLSDAQAESNQLEQAYQNLRSVEDWDSLAEVLSLLFGGARTAAPWARGILGQQISPLMYQSGYYGEQG